MTEPDVRTRVHFKTNKLRKSRLMMKVGLFQFWMTVMDDSAFIIPHIVKGPYSGTG